MAEVAAEPSTAGVDSVVVGLALLAVAMAWQTRSLLRLRAELAEVKASRQPKPGSPPSAAVAGPTAGADELSAAQVAVIAAAVHMVFGAKAQIVSVGSGDLEWQAWSREGRRQVFQSHKVR